MTSWPRRPKTVFVEIRTGSAQHIAGALLAEDPGTCRIPEVRAKWKMPLYFTATISVFGDKCLAPYIRLAGLGLI
jgi:hypothetical protein